MSITKLKKTASEWTRRVEYLKNMTVPTAMEPERRRLMRRAIAIKTGIESGVGPLENFNMGGGNTLGIAFIPALLWAGTAGAVTAITGWTTDFFKFDNMATEVDKLVKEQGVDPTEAWLLVQGKYNPATTWDKFLESPLVYLIPLSIGGYLLYRLVRK